MVLDKKGAAVDQKSAQKIIKKLLSKSSKKWKRARKESCSDYIQKVMKQVQPDSCIPSEAMSCSSMISSRASLIQLPAWPITTTALGKSRPLCACCCPGNWRSRSCRREQRL
ncbi:putative histone H2B type 2-D [Scyliorhinus canicula]|uniref:putative histone H2B type 2-D n=1 Tax=Scyliorhinus canicula TaxID=7830 RepID=UPI0018F27DEC|nr:putative histone H2B type 2-D [Scyliorhinus canicula]